MNRFKIINRKLLNFFLFAIFVNGIILDEKCNTLTSNNFLNFNIFNDYPAKNHAFQSHLAREPYYAVEHYKVINNVPINVYNHSKIKVEVLEHVVSAIVDTKDLYHTLISDLEKFKCKFSSHAIAWKLDEMFDEDVRISRIWGHSIWNIKHNAIGILKGLYPDHAITLMKIDGYYIAIDFMAVFYTKEWHNPVDAEIFISKTLLDLKNQLSHHYGGRKWNMAKIETQKNLFNFLKENSLI